MHEDTDILVVLRHWILILSTFSEDKCGYVEWCWDCGFLCRMAGLSGGCRMVPGTWLFWTCGTSAACAWRISAARLIWVVTCAHTRARSPSSALIVNAPWHRKEISRPISRMSTMIKHAPFNQRSEGDLTLVMVQMVQRVSFVLLWDLWGVGTHVASASSWEQRMTRFVLSCRGTQDWCVGSCCRFWRIPAGARRSHLSLQLLTTPPRSSLGMAQGWVGCRRCHLCPASWTNQGCRHMPRDPQCASSVPSAPRAFEVNLTLRGTYGPIRERNPISAHTVHIVQPQKGTLKHTCVTFTWMFAYHSKHPLALKYFVLTTGSPNHIYTNLVWKPRAFWGCHTC